MSVIQGDVLDTQIFKEEIKKMFETTINRFKGEYNDRDLKRIEENEFLEEDVIKDHDIRIRFLQENLDKINNVMSIIEGKIKNIDVHKEISGEDNDQASRSRENLVNGVNRFVQQLYDSIILDIIQNIREENQNFHKYNKILLESINKNTKVRIR